MQLESIFCSNVACDEHISLTYVTRYYANYHLKDARMSIEEVFASQRVVVGVGGRLVAEPGQTRVGYVGERRAVDLVSHTSHVDDDATVGHR